MTHKLHFPDVLPWFDCLDASGVLVMLVKE
jgi:hypothetical protein